MSETDLARSWKPLPARGGEPPPDAMLKEGRMPETLLSARDLSCSDQLKPWSVRVAERMSEGDLEGSAVLAWAALTLRPAVIVAELEMGGRVEPPEERRAGWSGLPVEPGLEPPGARMERMALAPKLIRRAKGVVGAVRFEVSSSSMAFSSMESELLVEMLPRRMPPKAPVADAGAGGPPERPRVVTERRRRGSLAAAAALPLVPVEVELLRWKRLENAAEVTEPRRSREPEEGGLLSRSLDMVDNDCSGVFDNRSVDVGWVDEKSW